MKAMAAIEKAARRAYENDVQAAQARPEDSYGPVLPDACCSTTLSAPQQDTAAAVAAEPPVAGSLPAAPPEASKWQWDAVSGYFMDATSQFFWDKCVPPPRCR